MDKIAEFSGEHRFLSNFYPSRILLGGKVYPTAEHAYQASKFLDDIDREHIRNLPSPGQAKRSGKYFTLRPDWLEVREEIMYRIVRQKFNMNPELKAMLFHTGLLHLEEGNYWNDTFWGVCNGKGENKLGKILMRVREEIR